MLPLTPLSAGTGNGSKMLSIAETPLLTAVVALWIVEKKHRDHGFEAASTCLLQFGMQTFSNELAL